MPAAPLTAAPVHAAPPPDPAHGIVDSHFHVIAPVHRYPMHASRSYTTEPAALADWQAALGPQGVTHGMVVQPSFYGTDNRVLLEALAQGGERLVGIAAVGADVTDAELDSLAAARVRGVRTAHFEPGDPRAMGGFVPLAAFDALEDRLAARGLHLQLFTDSRLLPAIEDRLLRARVPVVIDHMGRAPAHLGAHHPGIDCLVRLMQRGAVWVKLSGLGNISDDAPGFDDVRPVHDVLLHAAPDRLVWGSDWPHTRPAAQRPDTAALLRHFQAWTPSPAQHRIAWTTAQALYGFGP